MTNTVILDPVNALDMPDSSVHFQKNWLTVDEADGLYLHLRDQTSWEQRSIIIADKKIPQPRLVAWYGEMPYTYSRIKWQPKALPPPLQDVMERLNTQLAGLKRALNSCLLNYYRNGSDSIGFHADNEPELGREPLIASISLGATRDFQFKHKTQKLKNTISLTNGSLLVMSGQTQNHWLHGINKIKNAPETVQGRINLTFRQTF